MEEIENKEICTEEQEDRRWCVYMHTNKANGKVYIGKTNDIQKRWGRNGNAYKDKNVSGSYKQSVFAKALDKYPNWDEDWLHEIVIDKLTHQEACEKEIELIALYKSNVSRWHDEANGYNMTDGGEGVCGHQHTEESKKIMSQKAKERLKNPENHPMFGKHISKETKAKNSQSNKDKWKDDEYRRSMCEKRKYRYNEEWIEQMRKINTGRKHTDEARRNMSIAQKNKWTDEMRQKMSEKMSGENSPIYGRHHTEEAKTKMRGPRPRMLGENNPNYGRVYSEEEITQFREAHRKEMKPIVQLDLKNHFINQYESIREASRQTNVNRQCISFCLQGKYKTAGGFYWMYKEDYEKLLKNLNEDNKEN